MKKKYPSLIENPKDCNYESKRERQSRNKDLKKKESMKEERKNDR